VKWVFLPIDCPQQKAIENGTEVKELFLGPFFFKTRVLREVSHDQQAKSG
jgi:hypothetical protein